MKLKDSNLAFSHLNKVWINLLSLIPQFPIQMISKDSRDLSSMWRNA